jgi:uncharacterized protein
MKDASALVESRSSLTPEQPMCTAFQGQRCIASGPLPAVARRIKAIAEDAEHEPMLVFEDLTGGLVEIDLRGTVDEVVERLSRTHRSSAGREQVSQKRGPGRPKLGVIAREVTLLPAQWDWLDGQPGGASAALRRLVHLAKRSSQGKDRARQSQEAVYRFMTAMAGDLPGFEEALRSFYRREHERFGTLIASWPQDIRDHVKKMVASASRDQAAAQEKEAGSRPV